MHARHDDTPAVLAVWNLLVLEPCGLRTGVGKAGEPVQNYAVQIFRGMFGHIKSHFLGVVSGVKKPA